MSVLDTGHPPDKSKKKNNTNGQQWSEIMMEETGEFTFYKVNLTDSKGSYYDRSMLMYNRFFPKDDGFLQTKFLSPTSMMMKVANDSLAMSDLKETMKSKKMYLDFDSNMLINVEVSEVASLNSSQGTIFAPELNSTSTQEIIDSNEQIREIERLTRWDQTTMKRVNTDRYKITFKSRTIPERVNIGFLRFGVRQFYPLPRGCLACLRYDHLLKYCPQKEKSSLCRKCGLDAGLNLEESTKTGKRVQKMHKCQEPPQCPNCPQGQNEHGSASPDCPARKKEAMIIKLKIDQNLTYGEAKRRINDPSFRNPGQSFTSTFANVQGPSAEIVDLRNEIERQEREKKEIMELRKKLAQIIREKEEEKKKYLKELEYLKQMEIDMEATKSLGHLSDVSMESEELARTLTNPTTSTSSKPKQKKPPAKKPLKYKELDFPKDPKKTKEVTQAEMVVINATLNPADRQRIKNLRDLSKKEKKTLIFLQDDEFLYSQWK